MRLFYCLAIGMLLARSLGLCCFAEWAKTPHAHAAMNVLAPITSVHQHEHASSMVSAMDDAMLTIIHGDGALSVSFGEWNNLLSDFYFLVSPHTHRFADQLPMIARIGTPEPVLFQAWRLQFDPPPRPIY